jgi:hypothetical protein
MMLWLRLVLGPIAAWPLYIGDKAVVLPLLVIDPGCSGPTNVTRLLVLARLSDLAISTMVVWAISCSA